MATRRRTPKVIETLFGKFDQLDDDQFLQTREAVNQYYKEKFVEEEEEERGGGNGSGNKSQTQDDAGWVTRLFGE